MSFQEGKDTMTDSYSVTRIADDPVHSYKLQAKRLREAMQAEGTPLTHAAALELVARQHGARDWNTLVATARQAAPARTLPFAVGAKVEGRYLGQSFTGRILSVTALPSGGLTRLVIHFDEPVDVVTFDSFSAFRRRITAVVDGKGISPRHTSNGVPHLVLES